MLRLIKRKMSSSQKKENAPTPRKDDNLEDRDYPIVIKVSEASILAELNERTRAYDAMMVLRERVDPKFGSSADPNAKQTVIRYDDKGGRPTGDEDLD